MSIDGTIKLTGLLQYLAEHCEIDPQTLQQCLQHTDSSTSLVESIVQKQLISSQQLAKTIAQYYSLPFVDLDKTDLSNIPQSLLDNKLVQKHQALPLDIQDQQLVLAVADPSLPQLDEIHFHTGLNPKLVVVAADKLSSVINQLLSEQLYTSMGEINDAELEAIANTIQSDTSSELFDSDYDMNDAPVVRFVYKILLQAVQKNASDIHFEPYEKYYRIRLRQDGILYEIAKPPQNIVNHIVARLKIMANLDIAERRLPQDGRFRLTFLETRVIDFRISTCPTLHGEKVVLRILDNISSLGSIEDAGMAPQQQQWFKKTLAKLQGMVLVTGPTGSGKTTTLYTALKTINHVDRNICTVEDPIEINLAGINQVPVNLKTGLTFSKALRAFLRQDPDIIMIGEIRDLETAEVAVRAAQTGHLVFSTLHTNSASETLVRLANMGIPSYNIASSISLIIAQRLVRRLCEHCKQPLDVPIQALIETGFSENEAENATIYGAKGCKKCTQGYQGRIAFFEVMPINKQLAQLIMSGANATEIAEQAQQQNIMDLRQAGLQKVQQGITSLEEINRVV